MFEAVHPARPAAAVARSRASGCSSPARSSTAHGGEITRRPREIGNGHDAVTVRLPRASAPAARRPDGRRRRRSPRRRDPARDRRGPPGDRRRAGGAPSGGRPTSTVVGTAPDVAEASALIEREAPDVVLCDIRLADGGDGFELVRHVRAEPAFIMLTRGLLPELSRPGGRARRDGLPVQDGDGRRDPRCRSGPWRPGDRPSRATPDGRPRTRSGCRPRASSRSSPSSPRACRTSRSPSGCRCGSRPSRASCAGCSTATT